MTEPNDQLATAYLACRAIAKREAKNFYYSFRALPRHKSDAMCAVYAFMRRADDISDDESLSIPARRVAMQQWLDSWRASRAGAPTEDPVFLALNDTQKRFAITDDLLEQLVRGTTMDLEDDIEGVAVIELNHPRRQSLQVYKNFNDLYHYCYLVASVVGLVCIRIFGYTDPHAEKLAEETGIAFQLTNILRDVREDAERGRIYLPLEDMRRTGTNVEEIAHSVQGSHPSSAVVDLLDLEIARARAYYKSSDELIPLLDKDSRAAMQVLSGIYSDLLERIAEDAAQVFHTRVSVPTHIKLKHLFMGMGLSLFNRTVR
jgi:phytoene synthase